VFAVRAPLVCDDCRCLTTRTASRQTRGGMLASFSSGGVCTLRRCLYDRAVLVKQDCVFTHRQACQLPLCWG